VAQKEFPILKAHAGHPQSMAICVLKVMNQDGSKSLRAWPAELRRIALCRSTPRRLPTRVVDLRDGLSFTGEDKLGVLAATLVDKEFLADCRRRIVASRARLTAELARLHFPYAEPHGNFVFFDTGVPIKQFTEFMQHRNIAVGRRFPRYENWCRVTIGTDPQIDAFIEGVRAFRASLAKAA
jgi:hypothetical protein